MEKQIEDECISESKASKYAPIYGEAPVRRLQMERFTVVTTLEKIQKLKEFMKNERITYEQGTNRTKKY